MGFIETVLGAGGGRRDLMLSVGGLFSSSSSSSSSTSAGSTFLFHLLVLHLFWILTSSPNYSVMGGSGSTECMKRKYYEITVSYFGGLTINRTIKCDMYFQWTVADYCCYDKYDRFERNPFCCYSETYKLVLAVGFICLVLLGSSFSIFCCWLYNLPHHLLYLLTCGKFHLNDWMLRNKNGPYVDPTFYSGEPFWARGGEMQMAYPLRPMPPKIFYPAPPPKLKYRWDMANGEIPLFVIASRQFTRNPYSARPQDRTAPHAPTHNSNGGGFFSNSTESRRNSLSSNHNAGGVLGSDLAASNNHHNNYPIAQQQRQTNSAQGGVPRRGSSALYPHRGGSQPPLKEQPPFQVNIDEMEAAQELFDALKMLEEKGDKTAQEWNAMVVDDSVGSKVSTDDTVNGRGGSLRSLPPSSSSIGSGAGTSSTGIFTLSDTIAGGLGGSSSIPLGGVRPNTTGGGGLDQYGNYVSLTNHTFVKPNTEALNQQLSTLGLPIYTMPGVHTAGVQNLMNTVQNYHVVSSNLGNPMETILEDDSLDDEIISECGGSKSGDDPKSDNFDEDENDRANDSLSSSPTSPPLSFGANDKRKDVNYGGSHHRNYPSISPTIGSGPNAKRNLLKRRATTITSQIGTSATVESPVKSRYPNISRVSSAMDHVVGPTPTTRADVPFMPTLPGSLNADVDATFIDTVVRRNSVI